MKLFFFDFKLLTFYEASGLKELDTSIAKFRDLRDEYRQANKEYFGDHLFAMLDEK